MLDYEWGSRNPALSGEQGEGGLVEGSYLAALRPCYGGVYEPMQRIGLDLWSAEEEVNRVCRRARGGGEPGWAVRCQAEGCDADLREAKPYHRRHKVCEFHSKASTVITAGLTQRFCQQCSRFHVVAEFDNGKRSCRKRLADHNRRRRKIQQSNQGTTHKSQPLQTTSSIDSAARSAMESTGQSAWSVTVAVSPARMSMERLNQRPY